MTDAVHPSAPVKALPRSWGFQESKAGGKKNAAQRSLQGRGSPSCERVSGTGLCEWPWSMETLDHRLHGSEQQRLLLSLEAMSLTSSFSGLLPLKAPGRSVLLPPLLLAANYHRYPLASGHVAPISASVSSTPLSFPLCKNTSKLD